MEGQAARLLTGNAGGAGTLRIVRAINANHYLEVVTEGFLNLTTIYDRDPATGTFPAVHSRHFGLLGQPVFAQYTGVCRGSNTAATARTLPLVGEGWGGGTPERHRRGSPRSGVERQLFGSGLGNRHRIP